MKRLYKSRKNKVIDGVCGGIAEYFEVDPVLVRVIFVLFFFIGGSALIAYIVGMIIIPVQPREAAAEPAKAKAKKPAPKEAAEPVQPVQPVKTPKVSGGSLVVGIILLVLGALFLMKNLDFPFIHWDFWWWFNRYFWKFFIPGLIIVVGIVLIVKSGEREKK